VEDKKSANILIWDDILAIPVFFSGCPFRIKESQVIVRGSIRGFLSLFLTPTTGRTRGNHGSTLVHFDAIYGNAPMGSPPLTPRRHGSTMRSEQDPGSGGAPGHSMAHSNTERLLQIGSIPGIASGRRQLKLLLLGTPGNLRNQACQIIFVVGEEFLAD
jgi:hypothetical protein